MGRLIEAALHLLLLTAGGVGEAAHAAAAPEPFAATRAEDLRPRIALSDGRLLLLTPEALYRFQPESEAWTVTTSADHLPEPPLVNLSATSKSIWIAGTGAAFSDPRYDDWQGYSTADGLPGREVLSVETDDDYAYAATDAGAGRFDMYTLEWEALTTASGERLGAISDVALGEDRVWFALAFGVAEYQKDTETWRVDRQLGQITAPRVLALRQTTRFLWALTETGLARYEKSLRTWTSYPVGTDLPDARVRQFTLQGDDVWLGTDAGLWRYGTETGMWRRDESSTTMPGSSVLAFALETGRIWVATESAFAQYDLEASRWTEFTAGVSVPPSEAVAITRAGDILMILGSNGIAYGLAQGHTNPNLFTWRSRPVLRARTARAETRGWHTVLDESGLGLASDSGEAVTVKGGATVYIDNGAGHIGSGIGALHSDTRYDLTLNGRLDKERTLSGFYNSTDPENSAYQLTFRGARSDALRSLSLGEIEVQPYNARLTPGTGLKGGQIRLEKGERSEETHRRLVTVDGWVGRRRTLPGRDTFVGGSSQVEGEVRDVDYVKGQVFPIPDGWSATDLASALLYVDDGDPATDDANTRHGEIAGRPGDWDLLKRNRDYVLGPSGRSLILNEPLHAGQALAVAGRDLPELQADLTHLPLRNHYAIGGEPVAGSMRLAIIDREGSDRDETGDTYLHRFGLDPAGNGQIAPERISAITGLLSFPDTLPFPSEVYGTDPVHLYTIQFAYRASVHTFRLSHANVVPGSERITVDREPLRPDIDYSIIPSSGLFIFFETVLLDEDSAIEIRYEYETEGGPDEPIVSAGQVGLAPTDHLFVGANVIRSGSGSEGTTTADVSSRLEWKNESHFLRLVPELAWSREDRESVSGSASGIAMQGRFRKLEVAASQRSLGKTFTSFEDRSTIAGRLREEANGWGRVDLGHDLQAEVDWRRALSDSPGGAGVRALGEESSLSGKVRLLRGGLPNLEVRRGRVLLDAEDARSEKWITRADLEISPDQAGFAPLGIRRLWLRTFFQRSDRRYDATGGVPTDSTRDRVTDHAFARLNGSVGSPLSWNIAFEDRSTKQSRDQGNARLRRFQKLDASLQSQPHPSVDTFLRWEADRDLAWIPSGGNGGFRTRRLFQSTSYLYPGRITTRLAPLSFRLDLSRDGSADGEPGIRMPGASSLWSEPARNSRRQNLHNRIVEGRLQITPALRIVERWEDEASRFDREGLANDSDGRRLEHRFELRISGGWINLRAITGRSSGDDLPTTRQERLFGEWEQTWRGGWLTYLALDGERSWDRDRAVEARSQAFGPQARLTWRQARWQTDAGLGASLDWTRTWDASVGATSPWSESRRQTLTTTLSLQPFKLFSIKALYELNRSRSPSGANWRAGQNLRIRLLVRT